MTPPEPGPAPSSLETGIVAEAGRGASLLAHGGAWAIPDGALPAHREGLREAVAVGRTHLLDGAPALAAAVETVAAMEAHGAFDAGRGAMLNQQGEAELDAGAMDGATLRYGAVMAARRLGHPVRVAGRLLEAGRGEVRLLTGAGAERFAASEGFALVENETLVCPRERARYEAFRRRAGALSPTAAFLPGPRALPDAPAHDESPGSDTPGSDTPGSDTPGSDTPGSDTPGSDTPGSDTPGSDTVGCVARDRAGRLAVATSTGGTPFKPPGRVGDSPLPGSGFYATERVAAAATGWGEAIAAVLLSGRTAGRVASGCPPAEAAAEGLRQMHAQVRRENGAGAAGGLLVLRRDGRGAWAFTTPRMARAGWHEGGETWVAV